MPRVNRRRAYRRRRSEVRWSATKKINQHDFIFDLLTSQPIETSEYFSRLITDLHQGIKDVKDPKIKELQTQLKSSFFGTEFENILDQLDGYNNDISITLEGVTITLEELKILLNQFQTQEYTIERIRIQ